MIDPTWLVENTGLTPEQFRQEAHNELRVARPEWIGGPWDRAGGADFKRFNEFVAKVQPGDEIWTFKSPPESWRALAGRAGFAIVRGGQVVADLVTVLS